ncbi:MAG: hypothetical protein CFH34_00205 [Alphaproteobacteria bacterium MarineAlpha9_Bin4]|nr:hypothetical protein [Pelagibacterales bacterium]PPR27488.1 MAG: hypothetical protein CFH34_00205 [Alphaproteobacteria bacterium MarineAlpha9_Bin4]
MFKLFIILILLLTKGLFSKEIIVNITGVAKVGKECFLSVEIQDNSKPLIENIDLLIYSLDEENALIGKSNMILRSLRKKQPYKTFTSIDVSSVKSCKKIKKVDLVIKSCELANGKNVNNCLNFFEINKIKSISDSLEVNVSNNYHFYSDQLNKDFFIPELDLKLKVLDVNIAKYYKIKNYKNGLVVVNNNNSLFKEGDLIIEAEMNSIFKIKDLNDKIKIVKNNKKKSILISLVREQQEKFVAVFLK